MLDIFKQNRKELCPFCFEYFYLRNTPFRCTSPMARCTPVEDRVLSEHWGDQRPVGRVLAATDRFARAIRCVDCGHESRKRLCPLCHSDLPHTIGDHKNYIFAVIGAKGVGKSHYIAVLIDQIKTRIGPSLNMLLEPMNDDTIRRYREYFHKPIFSDRRAIEGTKSALADHNVQRPLIYSLTLTGKGFLGKNTIRAAAILVFFDTAGEDLNSEDVMSTVNKYIYRSDGILLLIDPLQLTSVRHQLGKDTALPAVSTETADILTRTTRLVQMGRNLKVTEPIPIPLAVVLSKFDAVKPLLNGTYQLNASARHEGGFDESDFHAINSEMMALLDAWGGQGLIHQVRTLYSKFGFFGISALGCNPHATMQVPHVSPKRVEDPFLWLLAQNKLLRVVPR